MRTDLASLGLEDLDSDDDKKKTKAGRKREKEEAERLESATSAHHQAFGLKTSVKG